MKETGRGGRGRPEAGRGSLWASGRLGGGSPVGGGRGDEMRDHGGVGRRCEKIEGGEDGDGGVVW